MAKTLSAILQEHVEDIVLAWAEVVQASSEHYNTKPLDELKDTVGQFFDVIVDGVDGKWSKLQAFAQ